MYVAPKANALTQKNAPDFDAISDDDSDPRVIPKIHAALAENLEKISTVEVQNGDKSSVFNNVRLPEFFRAGWDLKFTMLCLLLLFGVNLLFYGMTQRISTHDAPEISFSSNGHASLLPPEDNMLAVYPHSQVPAMQPIEFDNQRVIFFSDKDRSQLLRYLKRPVDSEAGTIETYVKPK